MLVAGEYVAEPADDDTAFAFGLGLILDGLQRLLEQSRQHRSRPTPRAR
jgi:hypothetical protein